MFNISRTRLRHVPIENLLIPITARFRPGRYTGGPVDSRSLLHSSYLIEHCP